jgi:hypothetical protein
MGRIPCHDKGKSARIADGLASALDFLSVAEEL